MRSGNFHIWVMNADGNNLEQLTSGADVDQSPQWLPSGDRIHFVRLSESGRRNFWMQPDGQEQEALDIANLPSDAEHLAWSPDGSRIAFHRIEDGDPDIWVLDVTSGELVQLTDDPAADVEPAWSPDGAYLAFVSERDGNNEIYVMRADGTGVVRLTDHPAHDTSPTWTAGE